MSKKVRMMWCVALMLMLSPLLQVAALAQDPGPPPPPPPGFIETCKEAAEKAAASAKELNKKLKPLLDLLAKQAKEMGASTASAANTWWTKMRRTAEVLTKKAATHGKTVGQGARGVIKFVGVVTLIEIAVWLYGERDEAIEYAAFLDWVEQGYSDEDAREKAEETGDVIHHLTVQEGSNLEQILAHFFHMDELQEEKRTCIVERKGPPPRDTVGDRGTGDKSGKLGVPNDNHGNGGCKAWIVIPGGSSSYTDPVTGEISIRTWPDKIVCIDY